MLLRFLKKTFSPKYRSQDDWISMAMQELNKQSTDLFKQQYLGKFYVRDTEETILPSTPSKAKVRYDSKDRFVGSPRRGSKRRLEDDR